MMKRLLLLSILLFAACSGPGKSLKGPAVFGTHEALETELAAVNSEIEQMDSLNSSARARIKQYQKQKAKGYEGLIIGAEAEIYNNELHRMALVKRKRQLEHQIQLHR